MGLNINDVNILLLSDKVLSIKNSFKMSTIMGIKGVIRIGKHKFTISINFNIIMEITMYKLMENKIFINNFIFRISIGF